MTAVDTAPPLRLDRYLALLAILMALVLGLLIIGERQQPVPSLPAIEGKLPPPSGASPSGASGAGAPDAGLTAEQAGLASRLAAAEQALRRAEAEIERLREENRALSERLEGEGAALDEIARRLAAVEAERDRLADEVAALTEARAVSAAELAERTERPTPPPAANAAATETANAAPTYTDTGQQPAAAATPPAEGAAPAPAAPARDPSAIVAAQPRGLQAALEDLMREQRELAGRLDNESGPDATRAASAEDPFADPAAESDDLPGSGRLITFNGTGGTVAEGVEAYRAGDFSTAEQIWGALAASGDPRAQFHFGALLYEGRTAAPDLVMAHVWLSRAVDGGHLPAIELRRQVRAAMSEVQYREALAVQTGS